MSVKCKHCGKEKGNHNAKDLACPTGKSHPTYGYTQFSTATKWEPK